MTGSRAEGFTLLEVVVAVAILAIVLTAALRLQVMDLNLVAAGHQSTRACLAAESLLWRWQVLGPPPEGQEEDNFDGFSFQVTVEPSQVYRRTLTVDLELKPLDEAGPARRFSRLLSPRLQSQSQ